MAGRVAGDVQDVQVPSGGEPEHLAAGETDIDPHEPSRLPAHPGQRLVVGSDPVVGAIGLITLREEHVGVADERHVEGTTGDPQRGIGALERVRSTLVIEI
jgi:hypothetical protein